jgi:hypothetical protein
MKRALLKHGGLTPAAHLLTLSLCEQALLQRRDLRLLGLVLRVALLAPRAHLAHHTHSN